MSRLIRAALVAAASTAALVAASPAAAIPVFDATNYSQNLVQAARALEQINHQIASLQNEAAMLQNMARNLQRIDFPQLARITSSLDRIDRLMAQARSIGFSVDQMDQRFEALFPGTAAAPTGLGGLAAAQARLDAAREGFRHAMGVQAQVVQNVAEDAGLLADLVARSQGAEGSLQAQQSTNQLLALSAKQQLQLQNLMAAEFRGQALERARKLQAEQDARAATQRFLGTGRAYTPR